MIIARWLDDHEWLKPMRFCPGIASNPVVVLPARTVFLGEAGGKASLPINIRRH
jgi:hypothetical protein